jgi:hypothetical protein
MLGRLKFDLTALVEEIFNHIPLDIWTSTDTKFLDPAIGGGQFVAAIEQRLKSAGHSAENISRRVYGCESNILRINYARNKHNLIGNYQAENAITKNWSNTKFDVIVGAPPFNSNDTSRDNIEHRGQGDNLAKKFVLNALKLCTGHIALIMPYGNRTYSAKFARYLQDNGLYKISPCMNHFGGVSTNPCVFYFNRSIKVNSVEDLYNTHTNTVPSKNIGQIFKNQPGRLNRIDYEHLLKSSGKYRIVVTTAVIKYTDDENIVIDMHDNTRGNWRVVFNCTTAIGKFGRIIVEGPDSVLSKSVHCLTMDSEASAIKMKAYLETSSVQKLLMEVKTINACNSKKFLKYIPMP